MYTEQAEPKLSSNLIHNLWDEVEVELVEIGPCLSSTHLNYGANILVPAQPRDKIVFETHEMYYSASKNFLPS